MAISTEAAFQCDWMTTVWCYGMTSMPLGCGIHSNSSNPTKRLESTFMKSTYSRSCGKQSLKMTQVSGKKNMEKIVSRLYTPTSTWSSSQSYQSAMVGSPARLQAAPWLRQVCQASADSCKLFSSRVRSTRPAWRQGFWFERHALLKVSQVEASSIFCLCPMVTHDGTVTNFPLRKNQHHHLQQSTVPWPHLCSGLRKHKSTRLKPLHLTPAPSFGCRTKKKMSFGWDFGGALNKS